MSEAGVGQGRAFRRPDVRADRSLPGRVCARRILFVASQMKTPSRLGAPARRLDGMVFAGRSAGIVTSFLKEPAGGGGRDRIVFRGSARILPASQHSRCQNSTFTIPARILSRSEPWSKYHAGRGLSVYLPNDSFAGVQGCSPLFRARVIAISVIHWKL